MGRRGPSIPIAINVPHPANSNESAGRDASNQFTTALSFISSLLLIQCQSLPRTSSGLSRVRPRSL